MFESALMFAQKAPPKPSFLITFAPVMLMVVVFYFLLIVPQRKERKQREEALGKLKKGDKILTTSGIYGEIYSIEADKAVVEIAPKVKITVTRAAIAGPVGGQASDNS